MALLTPAGRAQQDPAAAEREVAVLQAQQALLLRQAEEIGERIAALGGMPRMALIESTALIVPE
jgi:hypothetical protein